MVNHSALPMSQAACWGGIKTIFVTVYYLLGGNSLLGLGLHSLFFEISEDKNNHWQMLHKMKFDMNWLHDDGERKG